MMNQPFTHLDDQGRAQMVDIANKSETRRIARASGRIRMQPKTLSAFLDVTLKKGDAMSVARIAALMAAKRTSELIPLCHPLSLTHTQVDFTHNAEEAWLECIVTTETVGRTGVEMEALTAVSVALLALYDMGKGLDRGMTIGDIRLLEKSGGCSSDWRGA
ncbi:cyclic pyranopterin monophosphate synthase MoaC [Ferrovum sp.]|uniref:cyclic pyranopterin monophosphate synthase MoaC n=2 Tax=Ferrovum sp. TaxID=2609467 RepID=UPI002607D4AC|nr:cyclic pyranopterin monophosphate synthase MoaC [Ferrovum sp.]